MQIICFCSSCHVIFQTGFFIVLAYFLDRLFCLGKFSFVSLTLSENCFSSPVWGLDISFHHISKAYLSLDVDLNVSYWERPSSECPIQISTPLLLFLPYLWPFPLQRLLECVILTTIWKRKLLTALKQFLPALQKVY